MISKKYDVAAMQFYVDMEKALLEDEDTVKNKLENIVKH